MSNKRTQKRGYVKTETMLVVACIALVAGFLGGVVFSSFKLGTSGPATKAAPGQKMESREDTAKQEAKVSMLERKTAQNPEDVEAWVQLGNSYFDMDLYEKSIHAYKKSLELNGRNANVWTDLGVMYRRNGEPNKAIEAFDKAIEVDPKHEISRFNKGVVLMHDLGDRQAAILAWEELVQINPLVTTPNGQPVMELINRLKESMK